MSVLRRRRSTRHRAAFSPADVPGMFAWYRPDAGVTLVDGLVSQVDDQSGQANHITQATAGRRPSHGVLSQNGIPLFGFTGAVAKLLTSAVSNGLTAPAFTAFAVFRRTATTADTIVTFGPEVGGRQYRTYQSKLTLVRALIEIVGQGATIIPINTTYVSSMDYQSTTWRPFLNGESDGALTVPAQAFANDAIAVGARSTTFAEPWVGYLGDIIGYNRVLTDTERSNVTGYLGARYAIATV